MPPGPARHRAALLIALAGVALSAFTLSVHQRLATETGYTSFCNLGGTINCDLVLSSRYGVVFGVPVAAWGMLAFGLGVLLSLPGALGRTAPGWRDLALLGL